ncbi:hypothetical protein EAH89_02355 [Roseomonas nepalensis]|uniref:Uncharacterized protein n=1 Tax=Muricoccus nepalensis TaxID=1854500 RepID=A0A502GEF1_9PROT|nr:hypothetical protein EAH89_02355 [Roseomonas nepalensis]
MAGPGGRRRPFLARAGPLNTVCSPARRYSSTGTTEGNPKVPSTTAAAPGKFGLRHGRVTGPTHPCPMREG